MFCDEIEEFVGRLKAADVEVEAFKAPFMFHVYEILMPWADVSKETIASVSKFIDRQLQS